MVQIEEMTERSRRVEYDSMRSEETVSVQPRREGERIAIATARLGNEEMGHFPTQKSAKIKRPGYMITSELKTRLIEKIQSTDDQQVLREAIRLMDIQLDDTEEPFELTDEMNQAIEEARTQIKNGECFTHEQSKAEIKEWLGE